MVREVYCYLEKMFRFEWNRGSLALRRMDANVIVSGQDPLWQGRADALYGSADKGGNAPREVSELREKGLFVWHEECLLSKVVELKKTRENTACYIFLSPELLTRVGKLPSWICAIMSRIWLGESSRLMQQLLRLVESARYICTICVHIMRPCQMMHRSFRFTSPCRGVGPAIL